MSHLSAVIMRGNVVRVGAGGGVICSYGENWTCLNITNHSAIGTVLECLVVAEDHPRAVADVT